jgi:CO/xanthine dehydrogenase FAD-binding subunit
MIVEYHRPTTLEDALRLLERAEPVTRPLGGGTLLNRPSLDPIAVIDLQSLGLDGVSMRGNSAELGAALTLQKLVEAAQVGGLQAALGLAARLEAGLNLRNAATLGGTVAAGGGRSPLLTALLALDASVTLFPGPEEIGLGGLLPLRAEKLTGKLITRLSLPVNARLAFESVARTPADRPIVCAAVAVWPSGRARVALGGFGVAPTLAFDGTEPGGVEAAARSAYAAAGDEWASAEYRSELAGVLARRCLASNL